MVTLMEAWVFHRVVLVHRAEFKWDRGRTKGQGYDGYPMATLRTLAQL